MARAKLCPHIHISLYSNALCLVLHPYIFHTREFPNAGPEWNTGITFELWCMCSIHHVVLASTRVMAGAKELPIVINESKVTNLILYKHICQGQLVPVNIHVA